MSASGGRNRDNTYGYQPRLPNPEQTRLVAACTKSQRGPDILVEMRLLAALVLTCVQAYGQQAQTPLPEGVYRVGNGVTQPTIIKKTDAESSEEARIAKMSGTVHISVVVGVDGKVGDVRVTKSAGLGLDEKAIQAVSTWQFQPGLKDGMPVPVRIDVDFGFTLARERGEWALRRAVFNPPEGATRPVLTMAPYPSFYTPTGQTGSVTISFDVDPNGVAENLHVEKSSDRALESEVIRIVRGWQFRPGMKDGQPIPVRGTLEFVEGNAQ